MRFLIDANLSPRLADLLCEAGHDAVAVRDVELATAPDDQILTFAASEDRIVISHDSDFGALLAHRQLRKPSFILIRSSEPQTPDAQAALLITNLDSLAEELSSGAIVTFGRGRLRTRRLPLS